jgi:hypothetical protein
MKRARDGTLSAPDRAAGFAGAAQFAHAMATAIQLPGARSKLRGVDTDEDHRCGVDAMHANV